MLQACQRLGDFEIVRLLGKGGMGEVYEAQQRNPSRRVALKVLAPWLAADEDALRRFWREAEVPAQLDHPGIVRIFSTGRTEDGVAFYAMHLVQGISLAELMRRADEPQPPTGTEHTTSPHVGAPAPVPEAPAPPDAVPPAPPVLSEYRQDRFGVVVRVGLQAARALAAAHRQDVLHRDIKPSNLMVDRHGHLYLVDFGLTRALALDAAGSQLGAIRGTPWYMSPEQARGEALDGRSDLYSLGVTLYELVSGGCGPFTADRHNSDEVMRQVRGGQALPLRTVAPDVPPALERVVQRLMAPSPRRRYQSAEELAADLEALARLRPGERGADRIGRPRRRRAALLCGGALALAGCLALGLWLGGAFRARPEGHGGAAEAPPPGRPAPPPGPPAPPKPAPGPELLPEALRHRIDNQRVALLTDKYQPVWGRRLFGTGSAFSAPFGLNVVVPKKETCTLLALDDPGRRWFEFSAEVQVFRAPSADLATQAGLFFGWRRGAGPPYSCFLIQVEEPLLGQKAPGRLSVQVARFSPAQGELAQICGWGPLQPRGTGEALLSPLAKRGAWRKLRIRVVDYRVALYADGKQVIDFNTRKVLAGPGNEAADLDPRGALGVWVGKGGAYFREAQARLVPSEEGER